MNPAFQRYVEAASGLTNLTATKAEKVVKSLVKSGAAASDQVSDLVDDLMERQRKNRDAMAVFVKKESKRVVGAMGLVTAKEHAQLQRQVERLTRTVEKLEASTGLSGARSSTAKKTAAKKSTAKKTAAKKSTAKKTAAKKSTAKKTAAKKSTS